MNSIDQEFKVEGTSSGGCLRSGKRLGDHIKEFGPSDKEEGCRKSLEQFKTGSGLKISYWLQNGGQLGWNKTGIQGKKIWETLVTFQARDKAK